MAVALVLTAVFAAAGPAPAGAAVMEALDMHQLVQRADAIVLGTVVSQHARYDHLGRIVTDVTFDVEDTMKGNASYDHIVLTIFGGAIGDVGMRVPGEPGFADGERAIIFGRAVDGAAAAAGGPYRPVGMSQGVLPVRSDPHGEMVWPGGGGMALVQRVGGRLQSASPALTGPRPLTDVADRIRGLVAETGAP